MNTTSEVVLITGATGTVGSELVRLLASARPDFLIRCASRNLSGTAARQLKALGDRVVPTLFDPARPETMTAAFNGVSRCFLLAPLEPEMTLWHQQVVDAAKAAGTVEYIVKQSVMGARETTPTSVPGLIPRMHYEGEKLVAASGIAHTIIRPTIFAQHLLTIPAVYRCGEDCFYMPVGNAKIAFLDARDISALGAFLLGAADTKPYHSQVYQLTGPDAITASQISEWLSKAGGQTITHIDLTDEEFAHRLVESGFDDWTAERVRIVYRDCKEGWLGLHIFGDFERVTGKPSTSFARFATDHAEYFHTFTNQKTDQ